MKGFPLHTNFIMIDANRISRLRPRQHLMHCTQKKLRPSEISIVYLTKYRIIRIKFSNFIFIFLVAL